MKDQVFDEFHSDPTNWKLGIFYFCREDRRIIVPKRIRGLGWTLNWARPWAIPLLAAMLGVVIGIREGCRALGLSRDASFSVTVLIVIGVMVFCHRAANPRS